MTLSRDQILAIKDWRAIEVEVPEWGGSVWVRTMSVLDQEAYMSQVSQQSAAKDVRGLQVGLAAKTVCDEQGTLLFRAEDLDALSLKSPAALARIVAAAYDLNLINDAALGAAKEKSVASR